MRETLVCIRKTATPHKRGVGFQEVRGATVSRAAEGGPPNSAHGFASARFPVEYPVLRVCIKRPGHLITLLQQKNWFQLKFQSLSYWFQLKTFDIQGPAVSQPFQFQGYTLVQSLSWERRCSRVSRRSGLSIGGRV